MLPTPLRKEQICVAPQEDHWGSKKEQKIHEPCKLQLRLRLLTSPINENTKAKSGRRRWEIWRIPWFENIPMSQKHSGYTKSETFRKYRAIIDGNEDSSTQNYKYAAAKLALLSTMVGEAGRRSSRVVANHICRVHGRWVQFGSACNV